MTGKPVNPGNRLIGDPPGVTTVVKILPFFYYGSIQVQRLRDLVTPESLSKHSKNLFLGLEGNCLHFWTPKCVQIYGVSSIAEDGTVWVLMSYPVKNLKEAYRLQAEALERKLEEKKIEALSSKAMVEFFDSYIDSLETNR